MYNYPTIDISTARKTFSKIVDNVFLSGQTYFITKRNIPVAKITKIDLTSTLEKNRSIDTTLFGILKSKKSAVVMASILRKKAWKRF